MAWGVVWGCLQAASPLAFWWLDRRHVYALGLTLIAAVYIGFAVADGRARVLAVETVVAAGFVVLAAAAVTGSAWLLVAGLAGHGSRTCGSTAPASSPAPAGGRRSAPPSTSSPPPSSPSRSWRTSTWGGEAAPSAHLLGDHTAVLPRP